MTAVQAWNQGLGLIILAAGVITACLLILVGLALYLFPSALAFRGHKQNRFLIAALNVSLGWTFIGWVAALLWAISPDRPMTT